MPSRYNCAVMFVVKCSAAKIDESDVRAFDATYFPVLKHEEYNESPQLCASLATLTFRALKLVL